MAPLNMVEVTGWFSSTEAGVISLVVFAILSVALLALCAQCRRNPGNAYDVNGTTTDVTIGANGTAGVNSDVSIDPGISTQQSSWRDHSNMPVNTLERKKAYTT